MTPDDCLHAGEPDLAGPLILALETSSTACSVALDDGLRVHVDHRVAPRAHAQLLLPMIDALLVEAGVDAAALDAIAWGHGPGSFTGLRIAAAVTQAIAWAHDLPVIGCSSLEALALSGLALTGLAPPSAAGTVANTTTGGAACAPRASAPGAAAAETATATVDGVIALVDARMGELYWNAFRREGARLVPLGPDRLQRPAALRDALCALPPGDWLLVGDGIAAAAPDGLSALGLPFHIAASLPELVPDARWILPQARMRLLADEGRPASTATPVYLRDEGAWRRLDDPRPR